MTEQRIKTLAVVVITLIAAATLILLVSRNEGRENEGSTQDQPQDIPKVATSSPPKETVVIPRDFDWDEQDEEWFEELIEQVQSSEDTHSRWNYEFDEILQPGESIVTDGWEISEGVFQFTVLTPSEVISDGETLYQINADITEVGLSGDSSNMAMPRVMTRHGMEARIMIGNAQPVDGNGNPTGLPNRRYELSFTPEGVPEGIRLQGSASAIAKKP